MTTTQADPATRLTVAVYPLVPTRSFDDPLTYSVPADDPALAGLGVGDLVEIPLGPRIRPGIVAATGVEPPEGVKLRPVAGTVDLAGPPAELVGLAEWIADAYGCARTRALALVVSPAVAGHARAAEAPRRRTVKMARRMADTDADPDGLSSRAQHVLAGVPDEWTPVAELAEQLGTTRPTLSKLADAGHLEMQDRVPAADRAPQDVATGDAADGMATTAPGDTPPQLTDEQLAAVDTIVGGEHPVSLLMGVTGSGKTEVYLHAIEHMLNNGRGAIVLVPEIALTPQTAGRFERRFPGLVEVLHSNLTRVQRAKAWERIRAGQARVVVGPRSAVFAPVPDLGIIAIDEEHDSSYKQESEPRYDARRVAWKRAVDAGAQLVYGTATPRVESWHGIAQRIHLRSRVAGGRLAPIELVDLRVHGERFPLTEPLVAAIDQTLRRGNKAIIVHNRRGHAQALHCTDCGSSVRCENCDIAMTLHGQGAARHLACHHCGAVRQPPTTCPECSSSAIARIGAGTERLERDLANRFEVPVFRLDSDAARRRDVVAGTLRAFSEAGPSLLVGTQMVAKGHDFPDVDLAVLVDADTGLSFPDFRAEERSFDLVAQLAGRAGRSAETAPVSRVLVQTWDVDAEFLGYAVKHDVEGFLTVEAGRREALGYPPFKRLVRVLISAQRADVRDSWATLVAQALREHVDASVLGPAPLVRIGGRERAQILLKTGNPAPVAQVMRGFLGRSAAKRDRADVRILLDVDPQSLM